MYISTERKERTCDIVKCLHDWRHDAASGKCRGVGDSAHCALASALGVYWKFGGLGLIVKF